MVIRVSDASRFPFANALADKTVHLFKIKIAAMIRPLCSSAAALLFLFADTSLASSSVGTKRPFGVIDSFTRTKLYPAQQSGWGETMPFVISNDGRKLFVVTGSGDAIAKTYKFKLLMFDTRSILRFVRGHQTVAPIPTILAAVNYDQSIAQANLASSHGIKHLTSHNGGDVLLFLAPDDRSTIQLFKADIRTSKIWQLTDLKYSVHSYRVVDNGGVFLITGNPSTSDHCGKVSFTADRKLITDVLCVKGLSPLHEYEWRHDPPDWSTTQDLYYLRPGQPSGPSLIASRVQIETRGYSIDKLASIIMSPDRKKALLRAQLPDAVARHNQENNGGAAPEQDGSTEDGFSPSYIVLDLAEVTLHPLSDFAIEDSRIGTKARWLDNDTVFLPDVRPLPPQKASPDLSFAGAGVIAHLPTGRYRAANAATVASEAASAQPAKVTTPQESVHGRCNTTPFGEDPSSDGMPACYIQDDRLGLRISTDERYDRPADIVATDIRGGQVKRLLRLNPQFKDFLLGRVEQLQWTDENSLTWRAGLVLPPDYRKGRRYPVVVQTHGFDPNVFLIDGSPVDGPPYVAQALANKSIVVVQMMDMRIDDDLGNAGPALANSIEHVIEILDRRGIIDTSRIGLTGFSATGRLVLNMTVFPRYRPRAVVIDDSANFTTFSYPMFYGGTRPMDGTPLMALFEEEGFCGARPWGDRQAEWVARDPFFHLDNVDTAILVTENQATIADWWDVFSGLKRLKKPIEFRLYTSGGHPAVRPDVVLESQQRVVDWYDFWLNDRESQDPGKAQQYESWRELRKQKETTLLSQQTSVPYSRMTCTKNGR